MVENPGAAAGARAIRPLNRPLPAAVEASATGLPRAVLSGGVFRRVAAIRDRWRIDDEWWREEIVRRYFTVELEGGRRMTVYHDLRTGLWYEQRAASSEQRATGRGG